MGPEKRKHPGNTLTNPLTGTERDPKSRTGMKQKK